MAIAGVWVIGIVPSKQPAQIEVPVTFGTFESIVYATGQLQAAQSVSINVPDELSSRRLRIYEIKVTRLVDEGTVVDSGDYVASLDHSAVADLLTKAREDLQKMKDALEDARIDTSINLSNLRDDLLNAQTRVETQQIVVDQSVYESPATKRQALLDSERALRDLEQLQLNYHIKRKQDALKVARAQNDVAREEEKVTDMLKLFDALEIKAPQAGMVIYSLDQSGKKIRAGSSVSRWNPKITELPDLSNMISKTYINEIDISKIQKGQPAQVGIDAFPEKLFPGRVISVANIGQTLPTGDSKVFEVTILIEGKDPQLRPAMTTLNKIQTAQLHRVCAIPQEALFQNDTASFVYCIRGNTRVRQTVTTAETNENQVVIAHGLQPTDRILLAEPADAHRWPLVAVQTGKDPQPGKPEPELLQKERP